MSVDVTMETPQPKHYRSGSKITPKQLTVTLRFDLSAGGYANKAKLPGIVKEIAETAEQIIAKHGLDVSSTEGEWVWLYGPEAKGKVRSGS
jgi:hypothetical protein